MSRAPESLNRSHCTMGLSDSVAISIEAPYSINGSSKLKSGVVKTTGDFTKGIQSPTFTIGKRLNLTDKMNKLQYIDARLYFNPKALDDKSLRSDYLVLSLSSGIVISEDQKLSGALRFANFNANSSIESQTYTNLGVTH